MFFPSDPADSPRDPLDMILRVVRFVGFIGFLGGLTALVFTWLLGPRPDGQKEWTVLLQVMRAIFYPCVLCGLLVLVTVGLAMWWRKGRALSRERWFIVMMALLAVTVPPLHFFARTISAKLHAAVQSNELELALKLWNQLGMSFAMALSALLIVCTIAILKPRLGQRQSAQARM